MDSNYIPINIGDPDISTKIAQFIENTPDISSQLNNWYSGVVDQPVYFSNIDVWKNCTPLMDAITQLCSWEDINHLCLHFYRNPVTHQIKTNYPSLKIWENCDLYQMVFPILHWESDQYYAAYYTPLPGQEEEWAIDSDDETVASFPTMLFAPDRFWTIKSENDAGYLTWLDNQVTETDRVSTVEPYQPFLHNMESLWAVHKINEDAPGTLFLTVRVNADCNLVERYNLIPK